MAKQDFFPNRIDEQRTWLANFIDKLPVQGPIVGMTAPEVTACTDAATDALSAIDAAKAAEDTYNQKVKDKDAAIAAKISGVIRPAVKRFKTSPAYNSGIGEQLRVVGSDSDFDPDTFKPTGKATVIANEVKITFVKSEADGMAIYSRITSGKTDGGAPGMEADLTQFSRLAIDYHSPYIDNRPLAQPNTPETREYYLRGLDNDAEFGLRSDIIKIVVGD